MIISDVYLGMKVDKSRKNPFLTGKIATAIKYNTYTHKPPSESSEYNHNVRYVPAMERTTWIHNKDMEALLDSLIHRVSFRLAFHIINNLSRGADCIDLNREVICKRYDISIAAYYRGLGELKRIGLIIQDKEARGWIYWVNIALIFNGNQIDYILENNPDALVIVKTVTIGLKQGEEAQVGEGVEEAVAQEER